VSCSFDYLTRSAANLAYNYCLMGFEFVLPVSVIVVCYVGIVVSVRRQAGELRDIQTSISGQQSDDQQLNRMHRDKRMQEYKLATVRPFSSPSSSGVPSISFLGYLVRSYSPEHVRS